jgi:hypothetical protein
VAAFCALVVATVAAFFITQHLKVTTPLIAGSPRPFPEYINPLAGRSGICGGVDHRTMRISFYLLHRSDTVDVFVVNRSGSIVATLATGRHMRRGVRNPDGEFSWNGRESGGRIAPDGVYYLRVALLGQGRTVDITSSSGQLQTVIVDTRAPAPRVVGVQPHLIDAAATVAIRYTGTEGRGASVLVYRTDVPGRPRLVKTFGTFGGSASWDGRIAGLPSPTGIYLVGLRVTDAACNVGLFPGELPPPPGTTPGAGVTVRYLAAEPPSTAVAPGSRATVFVDARKHLYHWSLRRPAAHRAIAMGHSRSAALSVPIPRRRAGLYELTLRRGGHATVVPLVVHAPRPAKVLVVLPVLTWQALNPGDEDGDGVADTLTDGASVLLARPFALGLPSGLGDEEGLLSYLDSTGQPYDLTTDVGLIEGVGAALAGHPLVILAGTQEWVTPSLASSLRSYVEAGGHVVSLGIRSLLRRVTVSGGRASDPTPPQSVDALGARPGSLVTGNSQLIGVIQDKLGIFSGTSGLFSGFRAYQPFAVGSGATVVSAAGATSSAPSIIGYRLGTGIVTDIGLEGFGTALRHNIDAQQLMSRLVTLLAR